MKVKELIELLVKSDPEHDVVISGQELKFGCDFTLVEVHQYDSTNYVRLISGNDYEERDE
jgi:trimethylamine:corrinoid methyltransferase-like protein